MITNYQAGNGVELRYYSDEKKGYISVYGKVKRYAYTITDEASFDFAKKVSREIAALVAKFPEKYRADKEAWEAIYQSGE